MPCPEKGASVLIEPVIRPPAEASSFLLQVTVGCSSNSCTFCGAYAGKPFRTKPFEEIIRDIEEGARETPGTRRAFLLDGDALVLTNRRLVPVLKRLRECFRGLSRVASYANARDIVRRTPGELRELHENRLRLIYMGLESGNQDILDRVSKRSSAEETIDAVLMAAREGIKSSVIVLLGLGGKKHSSEHVRDTVLALNRMQPRYLSFLSLMLIPGTPLARDSARGEFEVLSPRELLTEARDILRGLELNGTVFRSDHASNHLALEGRFPQDKDRLLALLNSAICGKIELRPELSRGL